MTKTILHQIDGSVRVTFPNSQTRRNKGEILCRIGRDVKIDTDALENYCFRLISSQEFELSILAGVVSFADRTFRRKISEGWARHIKIIMPVTDSDKWNQKDIKSALVEALNFLTGDFWDFDFIGQRIPLENIRQDILDLGSGKFVIVPFSSGMDSFAQSQLLKLEASRITPIRITAWHHGVTGCRDWVQDSDGTKYRRISVPVNFAPNPHAEPSYRTRSFLFSVFAGIAAHLSGAEGIIIPENGQGAVGPSLVPFGSESPHRGSHPGFSHRMSHFFQHFWGDQIEFKHPQLWLTKGQVLLKLKQENLLSGWKATCSCPRDRRDVNLNHKIIQCGVCSGCLLRRLATFTAGISEDEDSYLWNNLTAPSLSEAIHKLSDRKTRNNDLDIAHHAVLAMSELSQKATATDDISILQMAYEISGTGNKIHPPVLSNLKSLLQTHKNEWTQFINHLGPKSWINQTVEVL